MSYRRLIVTAQFINCFVNGLFWVLALLGHLAFLHVVLGSVLIGPGQRLRLVLPPGADPDLVGKDRTTDAMVLETVPQNISRLIGPLMSGVLLEFAGTKGGFLALFLLQSYRSS